MNLKIKNNEIIHIFFSGVQLLSPIVLSFYLIFLKNESHFQLNRFFLLLSMLISVLVPLIPLQNKSEVKLTNSVEVGIQTYWLPQIIVSARNQTSSYLEWLTTTDVWSFLTIAYLIGLFIFLIIFTIQLFALLKIIIKTNTYKWNNCFVTESNDECQIFSFFNFIFIGNTSGLSELEKQKIFEHEKVHVSQLHTLDIIFSNIITIVFWFNPLIRIYKKELIQQHEFEADSRAVKNNEVNDYCNLLARIALQSAGFTLVNHFNNSLTIKRISTMQTIKKKINRWKISGLIVLFPGVLFIVACQKQAIDETESAITKSAAIKGKEDIFIVVEKMPEFPGGMEQWVKYVSDNIAFPPNSLKNGFEGTVYVSFEIDEKGNVTNLKIVKGLDTECDKEALRVISQSPKWIPGEQKGVAVKVRYSMPVKFTVSKNGKAHITAKTLPLPLNQEFDISHKKYQLNGKAIVEGTVLNKEGKSIGGAIAVQKGTTIGTITDSNGNFLLEANTTMGEISISHVGYETQLIQF